MGAGLPKAKRPSTSSTKAIMFAFWAIQVIEFLAGSLSVISYSNIEKGATTYIIVSLLKTIVSGITNHYSIKINTERTIEFIKIQYNRYDKLDRKSKEKSTLQDFKRRMNRALGAHNTKYTYAINVLMDCLTAMFSFITVAIMNDSLNIVVYLIITHACWYWFVSKDMVTKNTKMCEDTQTKNAIINDTLVLLDARLHQKECSVDEIIAQTKQNYDNYNEPRIHSNLMMKMQCIPNHFISMVIALTVSGDKFMPLYLICHDFNRTVSTTLSFYNRYKTMESDLNELEKFFENKTNTPECVQLPIPDRVAITGKVENIVCVENDKFHGFVIEKGDRILVTGKTGSGKTSLINGICGFRDGLSFSSGENPLAYNRRTKFMAQNYVSSFTTARITIRQLFYNESNDELIQKYIDLVQIDAWHRDSMNNSNDKLIENNISGGEKIRLGLAVLIYKTQLDKCDWLVLDEPNTGLDQVVFLDVVQNISNRLSDVTIFMIAHICECQVKRLGMNKIWKVCDKKATETIV